MTKKPIVLLVVLALILQGVTQVTNSDISYACSCAEPSAVEEELQTKTAIFTGKVINIHNPSLNNVIKSSGDPIDVLLEVDEIWKGIHTSQVKVTTALRGESCGFNFEMNKEYLVYAYGDADDLHTGLCERTTLVASATDDLSSLGKGTIPSEQVDLLQDQLDKQDRSISSFIWIVLIALSVALIVLVVIRRYRIK